MRVAYFVHDLADPAVARRVAMLRRGGADVKVLGFRRVDMAPLTIEGALARDLGRTYDGQLARRALAVAFRLADLGSWSGECEGAEVFLGRNLEMLALAAAVRRRLAPHASLAYELLDIHIAMLGHGLKSRVLRRLERQLIGLTDAMIISSPAFDGAYLMQQHPIRPAPLLIENKVLFRDPHGEATALEMGPLTAPRPPGPPWRIGWFGVIRCRRSLELLRDLVVAHPGLIEVDIRGRRANTDLGDFERIVQETPGLRFHGAYANPDDLQAIYGAVHFTWAVDFYEAGFNSAWLLPNRIYEGTLYGSTPIAIEGVETARWLAEHGVGITLAEPIGRTLADVLQGMTPERYRVLESAVRKLPTRDVVTTTEECRALVRAISERSRR